MQQQSKLLPWTLWNVFVYQGGSKKLFTFLYRTLIGFGLVAAYFTNGGL